MGALSIIAAIITIILFFFAYFIGTKKDSYKSGAAYLIIGIIFMIISVLCRTEDSKIWLFVIYGISAAFSFFLALGVFSKETRVMGAICLSILIALVIGIFIGCIDMSSVNESNSEYSQKCELCEDRNATKGKYCTKCYNTLKGFQNTWG